VPVTDAIGKCVADTALRDTNDLLARGVLRKLQGWSGVWFIFCSNRALAHVEYAQ